MLTVHFLGEDRPWRLTVKGLETFCDLSGTKLADYQKTMADLNTRNIKYLLWAGFVGGAAKEKKEIGFSYEEFIEEADNFDFDELIAILPKEKNAQAPESGAKA